MPDRQLIMKDARVVPPGNGGNFFWTLAVSPTNPEHLIVCPEWNNPSTGHFLQGAIYGSSDGGESWRRLKTTTGFSSNSEVMCTMDGDNGIYFTASMGPMVPQPYRHHYGKMYLWHSSDFGKTWMLGP